MEQDKRGLEELPKSDDEYWTEAERELKTMARPVEHIHFFVKLEGEREARCRCGFGIFLSAEDSVRDGHLYQNGVIVY